MIGFPGPTGGNPFHIIESRPDYLGLSGDAVWRLISLYRYDNGQAIELGWIPWTYRELKEQKLVTIEPLADRTTVRLVSLTQRGAELAARVHLVYEEP